MSVTLADQIIALARGDLSSPWMRARHCSSLAAIAASVRRLERSLDEIVVDAQGDAQAIERSPNVIEFKDRDPGVSGSNSV